MTNRRYSSSPPIEPPRRRDGKGRFLKGQTTHGITPVPWFVDGVAPDGEEWQHVFYAESADEAAAFCIEYEECDGKVTSVKRAPNGTKVY